MSIILTLSVGIAIILISSGKAATNVNSILFGSILTVSKEDLMLISIISIISILAVIILYDKLIYITFDEDGAKALGVKVKLINYIFTLIVGACISVSIQIMGILVISSMMVVPVATALQFKKGFKSTLMISIVIGFIDIITGLLSSYYINSAPGGTIAVTSVTILLISLIIKNVKNS